MREGNGYATLPRVVVAPKRLGAQDLLDDVADAALTAFEGGDVSANLLDVGASVDGAYGDAGDAEEWDVGHVVAHVEDLAVGQTVLVAPFGVGAHLGGLSHIDVADAETFVASAYTGCRLLL